MLESIFGNITIEKILFYLLVNERGYPSQVRRNFQSPLFTFQKAFARLEKGGILVSHKEGKNLIYQFNPRYPFIDALKVFLENAYGALPDEIKDKYYEPKTRKRPRRSGKPL